MFRNQETTQEKQEGSLKSAIYQGWTTHMRLQPKRNKFKYLVYMAFVNLDELCRGHLDNWPIFSSRSSFALTSLLECDHMIHEDKNQNLSDRVRDFVQQETGKRPRGDIFLLTNLRVLGVEFNPISFYYIFSDNDNLNSTTLEFVVAEVSNFPWFEQHSYLLKPEEVLTRPTSEPEHKLQTFSTVEKCFHVSPFMPVDGLRYSWQISDPRHSVRVRIHLHDSETRNIFYASLDARSSSWSTFNLCKMQILYPWHSLCVMGAILYEAAKLFRSGFEFFAHPSGATSRLSRAVESVVLVVSTGKNCLKSIQQQFRASLNRIL